MDTINPGAVQLFLLAVMLFEAYLALPPGIPYVTTYGLVPTRVRLANWAIIALATYLLYAFGFTFIESLALGSIWMTVASYLVLDYLYGFPLTP